METSVKRGEWRRVARRQLIALQLLTLLGAPGLHANSIITGAARAAAGAEEACVSSTVKRATSSVLLSEREAVSIERAPLSTLLEDTAPWRQIEAYSDQRPSIYMGATPYEMEMGRALKKNPEIPAHLEKDLRHQARTLEKALGEGPVEFEVYPGLNDWGVSWVFSRWRKDSTEPWKWLDERKFRKALSEYNDPFERAPILPKIVDPAKSPEQFKTAFEDMLKMDSLYDKAVFGDCLWTSRDGKSSIGGWLPLPERAMNRDAYIAKRSLLKNLVCRVLPPPARLNADPMVFQIRTTPARVEIPSNIVWKKPVDIAPAPAAARVLKDFGDDYIARFKDDIAMLSGEKEAVFPISGRRMKFTRKSSADPKNQLLDVAAFLEERYRSLGLNPVLQKFEARGIDEANLIVKIPGKLPPGKNHPVYMFDHFDTAFSEEVFKRSGKRVSVPGANDNGTATASLLRAAELLKDIQPEHDIYLVHLTGEEFPMDTLGSRHLMSQILKEKQDVGSYFLIDMIGFRRPRDMIFQINPGASEKSMEVAATLKKVSEEIAPRWKPVVRSRHDLKSYLNNTDGGVFEDHGLDGALINEHVNDFNNDRDNYHTFKDVSSEIDFNYATDISKVVIESVARTAKRP